MADPVFKIGKSPTKIFVTLGATEDKVTKLTDQNAYHVERAGAKWVPAFGGALEILRVDLLGPSIVLSGVESDGATPYVINTFAANFAGSFLLSGKEAVDFSGGNFVLVARDITEYA